jgi:hypothetical protein
MILRHKLKSKVCPPRPQGSFFRLVPEQDTKRVAERMSRKRPV